VKLVCDLRVKDSHQLALVGLFYPCRVAATVQIYCARHESIKDPSCLILQKYSKDNLNTNFPFFVKTKKSKTEEEEE
jgi:hypothetical protein